MSFDLFIGCFEQGEPSRFPAPVVEHAFGPFVTRREPGCLTVCFGDPPGDASYVYFETGADLIDSVNINRPVADLRLYEAILAILRSGNLVLCLPGDGPPLAGRPETLPHLPSDMAQSLGEPVVVSRAQEIVEWIERA